MPDFSQLAAQHSQQTGIPQSVYLALIQHEGDFNIPGENYPSLYTIFGIQGARGSYEQQFSQFDQLMFNSNYGGATQQLLQTGNIPDFFRNIAGSGAGGSHPVQYGYAAPSDNRPVWAARLAGMATSNGGASTSPRSATPASLPAPTGSTAAPPVEINTPWGAVYRTLQQIAGTPYQSPQERMYFLQSQGLTVNAQGAVVPITNASYGRGGAVPDSGGAIPDNEADNNPPVSDVTPATIESGVASVGAPGGSVLAGSPVLLPSGGMFGNQTTVNNAIAQATMAGVNQYQNDAQAQQAAADMEAHNRAAISQDAQAGVQNQGSEVAAAAAVQANEVFPGGS